MVLASLDRKIKFSCKSNCHFCLPWLDQEPQESACNSSSNETVKYGGHGLHTASEAAAKPVLLGTHTTLPVLGWHLEGWVFGTVGPDSEEVQIDIVAFWSHVNSIALGRVYLRNWTLGRPCLWVHSPYPQRLSEEKTPFAWIFVYPFRDLIPILFTLSYSTVKLGDLHFLFYFTLKPWPRLFSLKWLNDTQILF